MSGLKRVLVFAGLDPSGRAGLLADGQAISANGAQPVLCATAVAAQSARRLVRMEPVSPAALMAQAEGALEDGPVAAVKIGMVGSRALLQVLVGLLQGPLAGTPAVADPVLSTSSGGALFEAEPSEWLPLAWAARLVTPNLLEAGALTGLPCRDESEMETAARALAALGVRASLIKGGHLPGVPADLLWDAGQVHRYRGQRIARQSRGTGCRLASGIAARLAKGEGLEASVEGAIAYLKEWMKGPEVREA